MVFPVTTMTMHVKSNFKINSVVRIYSTIPLHVEGISLGRIASRMFGKISKFTSRWQKIGDDF